MYNVIIIGAGVIGASVARRLSRYQLKILLLEKNKDVGEETSAANSAVVHSGYDPVCGSMMAAMNVRGNALFPDLCRELDVSYRRIGSLTIAVTDEEAEQLEKLRENGLKNGVETEILNREELLKKEPFVSEEARKALYAPSAAIVNPFELVVALTENAVDNGVELHREEEVIGIEKKHGCFTVKTVKGSYRTAVVINCAGLSSDRINNFISPKKETIRPRKGEYVVLDHFSRPYVSHVIFGLPTEKGKGVLITPTTEGNYLIGPSSAFVSAKDDTGTDRETLDEVLRDALKTVREVPLRYSIREFAGVRATHPSDDFVIDMPEDGFINALGIQSPGLASSPAIGERIAMMTEEYLKREDCPFKVAFRKKENYNPVRRPLYRINRLNSKERKNLIAEDPRFGKIVCRCEQVSLGEVVDCINRSCGARSVAGVKRRVRPGAGLCQGGFCEPLIIETLAEELKKDPSEITYKNKGSYILLPERQNNE